MYFSSESDFVLSGDEEMEDDNSDEDNNENVNGIQS